MKYIILLGVLLLSGCGEPITRHKWDKAINFCGGHDKILSVKIIDSQLYVLCYQNEEWESVK